ncbi:hypothetical protein AAG570_000943 [Ranatra chinensis]|uniref:RNA-directed DNA polymerase n=1 Tax=Ranatra chinensis TaxID=642074 RepID=A0ABD0YYK1_9HEMI
MGLLATGSVLTGVTKRLTIIEGEEERRRLLKDYHVRKTNHRGVRETVSLLRRRYYWPKMTKMVGEGLAHCEVCARAKYFRTPQETPQMVTPTPEKPLDVVETDLVFLDGAIRQKLIDRLTRFTYNYPLQAKTGKRDPFGEKRGVYDYKSLLVRLRKIYSRIKATDPPSDTSSSPDTMD